MTQKPEWKKAAFTCPHCHTLSQMTWYKSQGPRTRTQTSTSTIIEDTFPMEKVAIAYCLNCKGLSIWVEKKMIYPESLTMEPNSDMPTNAKLFFIEAQSIIGRSPRAASALLRLALEAIVNDLNGTGKNLNEKINSLSLPPDMMTLFEACRLYGNQAAHPGVIDFTEENSIDIAYNLSNFINVIVALKISPFVQAKALINNLNNKKASQS